VLETFCKDLFGSLIASSYMSKKLLLKCTWIEVNTSMSIQGLSEVDMQDDDHYHGTSIYLPEVPSLPRRPSRLHAYAARSARHI
jgi:hypothetical protein